VDATGLCCGDTAKALQPVEFMDFADMGMVEKDLENLLAANLLDVLFEESELMPIFQERPLQAEADLYALDRSGQLWIFELKRGQVGADAMLQALGYGQNAGRWTYNVIEQKYRTYKRNDTLSLAKAHKEEFQLELALEPYLFNIRQKFIIIGNAANEELEKSVDYWKRQGLSVEFLPYRIYAIGKNHYFEFFALPYDRHRNPSLIKGVLFDTNASWNKDAVWQMMQNKWVAAYGDIKYVVDYLQRGDIVFYWHKGIGLIAAAKVTGPARDYDSETRYRTVEFLTPRPVRTEGLNRRMWTNDVTDATGCTFFWAKTIKVPYLSREQADSLLAALKTKFEKRI
jgi:hypothetical protein